MPIVIADGKLIFRGGLYIYNQSKPQLTARIMQYHRPELCEMALRCFCADISINAAVHVLSTTKNTLNSFYNFFRKTLYGHQFAKLKQNFEANPKLGRARECMGAIVYLYVYEHKLFVSKKSLKHKNCTPFSQSERIEIKKLYLKSYRKVLKKSFSHKFHLHLAEEIFKHNKAFDQRYFELRGLIG